MILKYDLIAAYKIGKTEHPQKVMKELGYNILKSEPVPIADCIFYEVENIIEPLPEYLEKSNFKFSI